MQIRRVLLVVAPVALLLAACSTSVAVPKADVETKVQTILGETAGIPAENYTVSCPADLEGVVGKTMTCQVTGDQGTVDLLITVTSVDGNTVNFDVEDAPPA